MRKMIMVAAICLLLFYTVFMYLNNEMTEVTIGNVTEVSPYPEFLSRRVNLYFIYNDALHVESRRIVYENMDVVSEVLKQLQSGPKVRKYQSALREEVGIISSRIEDRTCYVNFSNELLLDIVEGNVRGELIVWSIVNTLCELREVDNVLLMTDGKTINIELGGYYLADTLLSNSQFVYSEIENPAELVSKFYDRVEKNRFDLAYEMLDSKSKEAIRYEDFQEDLKKHIDRFLGYQRGIRFTQQRDERIFVYTKYQKSLVGEDIEDLEIFDKREVIRELGQWKVRYLYLEEDQ